MNHALIEKLARSEDSPCVSVLLPTTRMPDKRVENIIRLNNLVGEAKKALGEYGNGCAAVIAKKLDAHTRKLEKQSFEDGLAIFVSDTVDEALTLPLEVVEAVSVDSEFRIKELVYAMHEKVSYYLLCLSESKARLFSGEDESLKEIKSNFPKLNYVAESNVEKMSSSAPAPRWLGGSGKRDVSGDATATPGTYVPDIDSIEYQRLRQFFREVDGALTEHLHWKNLPVILATVERNSTAFKNVSGNSESIAGDLHGAFDHATAAELVKMVQPLLSSYKNSRKESVLKTIMEDKATALGARECWYHASIGRIETLCVEKNFEVDAGQLDDSESMWSSTQMMKVSSEEMIKRVYETGGESVFFEPGRLKEYGGVVAKLRY